MSVTPALHFYDRRGVQVLVVDATMWKNPVRSHLPGHLCRATLLALLFTLLMGQVTHRMGKL